MPTPNAWQTMPAGRVLDAIVAERVMGWRVETFWPICDVRADQSKPCERWLDPQGRPSRYHCPPEYSTDIGAAWEVVKAITARGFHAVLKTPFNPDRPYLAGFTPHGMTGWNGSPDFYALEATAPLAICRAALACVTAEDRRHG